MARDGHGAPGMGTEPPGWARSPVRTHSSGDTWMALPAPDTAAVPEPPALLEIRNYSQQTAWLGSPLDQSGVLGQRWHRGLPGMNPWFVLTVTEPNVPSEPLQGKALEKPWKSSSRGSNSTANMECSERRWTDEAGQESGAKEGFAGANSPGKTTRNPRGQGCASWDHPPWPHRSWDSGGIKERFGKCHIEEKAWKSPHFHPNSPPLPLQPGQTWKAKTETRKRENP